jgi:hypothetical protein
MAAKIGFTVTECVEVDPAQNLYRTRISTESKDGNQPLDSAITIKAPGGEETVISTDPGRGTATGELFFSSPAMAVILTGESRIQGNLLTARQSVTLKTKSSKLIPDRFTADVAGREGRYKVIGGVLTKDNTPVPDIPVEVYNNGTSTVEWSGTTDQHGFFASDEFSFTDSECKFLVRAGALEPVELTLPGPSKWRKSPEPPEPDPRHLCGGVLNTVASAWRQAGADKRRCP